MGVGAGAWCKHAAADKQIMLSLCCHGWQHTQRGAGALPGRRVHPFSQGGGEGEGEHEGGRRGGGGLVLIEPGSQTPLPLLAGMHTGPVGGEREKREGGGNEQTWRGEVKKTKKGEEKGERGKVRDQMKERDGSPEREREREGERDLSSLTEHTDKNTAIAALNTLSLGWEHQWEST